MHFYIAQRDTSFTDGSNHVKDRCYFPSTETQAYFDVMSKNYRLTELRTISVGDRNIPEPNHEYGYTKTYLIGWMESTGVYSVKMFRKWMSGQTVGVSDSGETVYYYNDVVKYFTQGGTLADIED